MLKTTDAYPMGLEPRILYLLFLRPRRTRANRPAALKQIGFSIFSFGSCPCGPQRLDPRTDDALRVAKFGEFQVINTNAVFVGDDGCVFVELKSVEQILNSARQIWAKERKQADQIRRAERFGNN